MPSQSQHSCRYCGIAMEAGQRFCSNCGSTIDGGTSKPTERDSSAENTRIAYERDGHPQSSISTPPPPPTMRPAQGQIYQPVPGGYQPAPNYATPQKDTSGKVVRQIGCGFVATILIILALCGGVSYFVYYQVSSAFRNASHTTISTISTQKPTAIVPPIVTTLHTKPVTYASVNISIIDAQQATGFVDDNNSDTGVLRLNLSEENTTTQASYYDYADAMLLLLPDGTSVHPSHKKDGVGPDASIKRNTWIDFPVPTKLKPERLTLRIGTSTESQIDVALKADADVTKYQPITSTPNKQLQYAGTTWTITNVSKQLSYNDKQADKDKVFIVVSLKIDNNSQNTLYPFPTDVIRLQSGDTKESPDDNTMPSNIAAGQTNSQSVCAFLMPANSTDFTFILLPNTSTGATQQVTTDFQVK